MSPGNSYFTEEAIEWLLKKVIEEHGVAAVFIADILAISTYAAIGYSDKEARSKAISKGNNLKNKTSRTMSRLGLNEKQIHIVDWKNEIQEDPGYQQRYKLVEELYKQIHAFNQDVDATTASVLEGFDKEGMDIEAATKIANHYLLGELAFLEYAPTFFNVNKIIYIYHRSWPVYEKYIAGKYDNNPKQNLGFEIVKKS